MVISWSAYKESNILIILVWKGKKSEVIWIILATRTDNESSQLKHSPKLDLIINSLNLIHESNELNLNWKLTSLTKWASLTRLVHESTWIMIVNFFWFLSLLLLLVWIYFCIFDLGCLSRLCFKFFIFKDNNYFGP